jgi:hypothetical protein
MARNPRDLGSGLIYLGCGATALVLARGYGMGSALRMGPGYFPTVLAAILCLIGLASLVRGLRPPPGDTEPPRFAWRKALLVLIPVVLFGVLLRPAGLIIAIPVLVVGSAAASLHFRWVPALALAAGLTAFSILVFVKGLKVPLPVLGSWFGS